MLISASQRGHLRKKSTLYSVFIQLSTLCGHCQEMVNVWQRYHRTRSGHVGLQRLEHPIVYAWLHYKGFNSFFPQSLCGSFDFWSSAFLKDLMERWMINRVGVHSQTCYEDQINITSTITCGSRLNSNTNSLLKWTGVRCLLYSQ